MLDLTEYTKFLIGLIAIVDPLGAVPVFLALTIRQTLEQQRKTARLTIVSVFVALMVALLLGEWILWALGISIDAFRCAGGLVLLTIGLGMVHSSGHSPNEIELDETVALVPLTMPLLAGPGAMSAVIVYAHKSTSVVHYGLVAFCILVVCFSLWLCFKFLPWFGKHLSVRTVIMSTRVMGLLLAAIAIEFIAGGIKGLFPGFLS